MEGDSTVYTLMRPSFLVLRPSTIYQAGRVTRQGRCSVYIGMQVRDHKRLHCFGWVFPCGNVESGRVRRYRVVMQSRAGKMLIYLPQNQAV